MVRKIWLISGIKLNAFGFQSTNLTIKSWIFLKFKNGKLFWIYSMSSTKLRCDDRIWVELSNYCTSKLLLDLPLNFSISTLNISKSISGGLLNSNLLFRNSDLRFMDPFGSSFKMILVVLSSLSLRDYFFWKQTPTPWCKIKFSNFFVLMQ